MTTDAPDSPRDPRRLARPERTFARNASFRYMHLQADRWLSAMRVAGQIDSRPPTLHQAYVCAATTAIDSALTRPVSEFFDPGFGLGRDGVQLASKNAVIRLLCIALKAHYFLFKIDALLEEPSVFWLPDLLNPGRPRFGLHYPLLKTARAIVVSEADLATVSSGRLALGRFPVVVTDEHARWLDLAHWAALEKEAAALKTLFQTQGSRADSLLARHTDRHRFPFGHIFEVPDELRPVMRSAGLKWAPGAQAHFLPRGFDLDPVRAFYDHKRKELAAAQEISIAALDFLGFHDE